MDDPKTIFSTMMPSMKESSIFSDSATANATTSIVHRPISQTIYKEDKNFETFALVWCNMNINRSEDNLRMQVKLRETVNFLRTFEDNASCELWLQQRRINSNDKIILIISDELGREMIPKVHDLPHIISIYLFCVDKYSNENWSKAFQKVRDCIND